MNTFYKSIKSTTMKFIFTLILFNLSMQLIAQIPYEDRHSQVAQDAWISNAMTESPNALRGVMHWISYDLGDTYAIQKSKIWNINIPDQLNVGARTLIIDYSIDGIKWNEWGRFELTRGTGSTRYEGEDGPNFGGLIARYLLINIVDNYGNPTSSGLAEIKVNVSPATVDTKEGILIDTQIAAYPNPFTNETLIDIKGLANATGLQYQVWDMTGREVMTGPVTSPQMKLNAAHLTPGIYTFALIHPTGIKTLALNVVK